jgi:hypothetical protein
MLIMGFQQKFILSYETRQILANEQVRADIVAWPFLHKELQVLGGA